MRADTRAAVNIHRKIIYLNREVTMSHDAAEHGIKITQPYIPGDDVPDDDTSDPFPQKQSEARTCVHGNLVWLGNECGRCEHIGEYVWADGGQ